jgi:Flp pilus assembly protein TadG
MVEFALVAPLFFLFVFMIAEGALFLNAQLTLDNSTREAARVVAICGANQGSFVYDDPTRPSSSCTAAAVAMVQKNLGIVDATLPNPTVSLATGYGAAGSMTVSMAYRFYVPKILGLGGPTLKMTSTAPVVGQQ